MKSFFYLLTVTLLASLLSCDTTEPPIDTIESGRRDYVWTIDTLAAPYNAYYRMWSNSPEDIWMVSGGFWDKSIAHYDGKKWNTFGVPKLFPISIYGFANHEIYISAFGGLIWRYDGASFTKFAELTKDGHSDIVFDNIWGESSDNFYALGAYPDEQGYTNNSVIAHHTDNKWVMLNTEGLYGIVEHLYKNSIDGKIYLQVNGGRNYRDSTHIYEYKNGEYHKLYSNAWTKGLQGDIFLINEEVFFVLGNQIYTRSNNNFNLIVDVNNSNFYQRIWGRNSKDLFLLMTDGLVHYNGNDIKYLFNFNVTPKTQIFGAALFEQEVFFLVEEAKTNLTLIYHGMLRN